MARTLVVTNDFPPRRGGIETFVLSMVAGQRPEDIVVYTASMPGDAAVDAELPFPVIRDRTGTLLPTARVARRTEQVLRAEGCDSVLFGAAASLGLLAHGLRRAGADRIVAMTHGHETWWSRFPGTRKIMRRIGDTTDVVTYLGDYTRRCIAPALSPAARQRMVQLAPGVDAQRFRPGIGGAVVREQLDIAPDAPLAGCIARLVPHKGQDTLVQAWPAVRARVPQAHLLIVGDGRDRQRLRHLVRHLGVETSVHFTGSVPDVAPYHDALDVFAMPGRTRRFGTQLEGLGIVFLEASATATPVVVGNSGGAPDACLPGETGYVVDGRRPADVSDRVASLLLDPQERHRLGSCGRAWVAARWTTEASAAKLGRLLDPTVPLEVLREPPGGGHDSGESPPE